MRLVILDITVAKRAELRGRIQEAIRQADLKRLEVEELDVKDISAFNWADVVGCVVGPGCYEDVEEVVERVRFAAPAGLIGVVLDNQLYASDGVALRKRLNIDVMEITDLVGLAGFVIACESSGLDVENRESNGTKNRGVVGVCQLKGGVGTTTVAAGLAACWAKHGLSVAVIDLDDVNPQLTAWARVGALQRNITSEFLQSGEVPVNRINELVHPVEGFEGRFVVVGQPEAYNESFHFKANVIEGAPSCGEFMNSLLAALKTEFDVIVLDMARSWGLATFASLPHCSNVLLVTDDDGMSVRRTLDALARLKKESDDPDEFDVARWSVLLNAYTGRLISPKEVALEIQEMGLLSPHSNLYTLPFSESGRQWGAPGQTLYELSEERTKRALRKIAFNLIPFKFEDEETVGGKLLRKVQSLVAS